MSTTQESIVILIQTLEAELAQHNPGHDFSHKRKALGYLSRALLYYQQCYIKDNAMTSTSHHV